MDAAAALAEDDVGQQGDLDAALYGYRVRMTSQFFKAASTPVDIFMVIVAAVAVELIIAWLMAWDSRLCSEQGAHIDFAADDKAKHDGESDDSGDDWRREGRRERWHAAAFRSRPPVYSRVPIAVRFMSKALSPVMEALSLGPRLVDPSPREFKKHWGLAFKLWPSLDSKAFFLMVWQHVLPVQAFIWWHVLQLVLLSLPLSLIRLLDEDKAVVEAEVICALDKASRTGLFILPPPWGQRNIENGNWKC